MPLTATAEAPADCLSKSEFARLIGVTPGRITQYITEGTIGQDALEGTGRAAKIKVDVARRQIKARRDLGQAIGNGSKTDLDGRGARSGPRGAASSQRDELEEQYKREKVRAAQIANRKLAEEEEARRGRFMDAGEARAEMARLAAAVLQECEGALPTLASALAAQFQIPQRDVLHSLRAEFRKVREGAARRHALSAAALPETVESIVVQEGAL